MSVLPSYILLKDPVWFCFLIFMIFWFISNWVVFFLLYRRRNHPYLKARSCNLLLCSVIGSGIGLISPSTVALAGEQYPCWVTHIGVSFSCLTVLGPDVIRCIRLWVLDRAGKVKAIIAENDLFMPNKQNEEKNNQHKNNNETTTELKSKNISENENSFEIDDKKRRKLLVQLKWLTRASKDRSLAIMFSIIASIDLLISIFFIAAFSSERTNQKCPGDISLSVIHTIITLLLYGVVFLVLSIAIFHVREEFNIKREIWINIALAVLCVVFRVIWIVAVPNSAYPYFPQTWGYHAAVLVSIINEAVLPLIKSYSSSYSSIQILQEKSNYKEPTKDLEHVLQNEKSSSMFLEFCKREFSSENYYFIQQLNQIEEIFNDNRSTLKLSSIEKLIDQYILEESPLSLNLSSETRNETLEQWETVSNIDDIVSLENLFSQVKKEVMKNLLDTFLRFRKSSQWRKYRQRLSIERDTYQDLIGNDKNDNNIIEKEME